jgi:integrase/recombinase XerD
MRREGAIWRPDLSKLEVQARLPIRDHPYFVLIRYGRHIGIHSTRGGAFWVARVRTKQGAYLRRRLARVSRDGRPRKRHLNYLQALEAAKEWFETPNVRAASAEGRAIGSRRDLYFSPIGETFTVGGALHGYVEWKRLSAATSHFEANVSLINHHLVPRLASLPIEDFNGEILKWLIREIIETPPKRGNQTLRSRRPIETLTQDELRLRKKTVNVMIGILRLSFQLAWENGHIDNDRPLRCLRRLRVVDRPRVLHLSRPECRKLLSVCRPDLERLVLGALYTGCRIAELLNMKCSHVGRDGYGVYITPSKTYRPRFVFLPDEAMHWFLSLVKGRRPDDLVFVRDSGKPWWGTHKHLFKSAVRAAHLPDDFTFHGLRHTYASQLIQAGATVFAVAEQLGHIEPTTVLRTYGHLSPQIRESEVRQRFSTLNSRNRKLAELESRKLSRWRNSLHGKDWRTYAKITDR